MDVLDEAEAQRAFAWRDVVSTGWTIAVGLAALLGVIRVSGHLTREIAREATRWCGVCGIEIAEGWVLFEMRPSPDEPVGLGRRTPVYFCRKHQPDDARAAPWHR